MHTPVNHPRLPAGIVDYGKIKANTGLGSCPTSDITTPDEGRMELFVNGNSKVLARYPNVNLTSGYWQWDNIVAVRTA